MGLVIYLGKYMENMNEKIKALFNKFSIRNSSHQRQTNTPANNASSLKPLTDKAQNLLSSISLTRINLWKNKTTAIEPAPKDLNHDGKLSYFQFNFP